MEYRYGFMQADALQNSAGIIEAHGVKYSFFPNMPSSATIEYGVHAKNHNTITFITTMVSLCSTRCRFRFDWIFPAEFTSRIIWA